jgi:shikimate dehydrogenase
MPDVFTFDDLLSRDRLDAGESKPARLAVIGQPVAHSASPRLHQPALDSSEIDARYIRIELAPGQIAEAFSRMRALGFIGCNVTVPHKFEAMATCDDVHPDAMALGAVNTVRFDPDRTRGFNTDGPGFVRAISDAFDQPLSTLNIILLGAGGGAGQAIAAQCALQGVPRLILVNRSTEKLAPLVNRLAALGPSTEVLALGFDDPELSSHCLLSDLVINTTSVGLKPGDPSVISASCLRAGHLVYDTIYQPAVTPLLALAQSQNAKTANGISLLLHQGVLAFQHWFPTTDPLQIMRKALES